MTKTASKDGGQEKLDLQDVLQKYMQGEEVSRSPSERHMTEVLTRYIDALNHGDASAILDMYADEAICVDPVGSNPIAGRKNIEAFVRGGLAAMRKAELSAPIRTCPGGWAAMAFRIQMDFGAQEVVIQVVDVMKFNAAGRIAELNAYWGADDVTILKGDKEEFLARFMPDIAAPETPSEVEMRATMQSYLDHINNKDADAFLGLFAQDFEGEDPVGTKPIVGLENLTAFVGQGMASKVELVAPIRTSRGRSAAMAFSIHFEAAGRRVLIDAIDVMKFNAAGKIVSTKAYWGVKNVEVLS